MLTAMSVISDLARTDPLGVQAGIQHHVPGKERTRILGFVTASLPPRLVRLLEAHTRLGEAAQKLEATRPPAPEPAGLVHQVLSPQRASARQQSVPDSSVEECLQNAIAAIDAAAGAYPGLRHTTEVAALYRALLFGIRARDLDDMGKFSVPDLPGHAVSLFPAGLRHTVRRLNRLAHTALSIKSATSGVNRRNLLLWANEQIEAVSSETRDAGPTFGPLLAFLTVRWRGILARAGGELSRATAPGPVPNPYVAGNPVVGSLFVGREDILRRLSELWSGEGQKPSVVLYGHRRMGKSSILHNLTGRFGPGTVVVDFNLQRTGHVEKTDELLLNLALSLYDSLDEQQKQALTEPASMNFMAFDRFLKNLDKVRNGRRFIVTLDEFEQIEQSIEDKRLDVELLTYFRGLIQTYPWLIMVFAGLHSLEEMRQDYWNPLFGSVTSIEVSFLSEAAARQLITQPTQEFDLDYDAGAVDLIIARTNGQPYLVQLICQALVTRFNREREQNPSRPRRFTAEDVQAVIGSPDFYRDGDAYFNGIYSQAESSPPPHQGTVLRALVGGLLSKAGLIAATGLDAAAVEGALATLSRHAVVREEGGRWCCTVELMRRWVETRDWGAEPAVV
jgi:AAA+ ATPase superfamily predicted ATPase